MKPHRIVVTRNKLGCGMLALWSESSTPEPDKHSGIFWKEAGSVRSESMEPSFFKSLFGFLPRKGSKQVYEMREVSE